MKRLICLILPLFVALSCYGAVPVILAPVPQLQFLDAAGRPLSFGCVYTFQSGTTTPLATYTDSSGVTQNTDPVILNAGGSANIWLIAGSAYTIKVVSAGGSQCVSGTTRYTVNGIGGGASQVSTNVSSSATPQFTAIAQNQLFLFTLNSNTVSLPLVVNNVQVPALISWQISQNSSGGWTFTWPANTVGGCVVASAANSVTSQMFLWNGSTATAVGPCTYNDGTQATGGNFTVNGAETVTGNATLQGNTKVTTLQFGTGPIQIGTEGSTGLRLVNGAGSFVNGNLTTTNATTDLIDSGVSVHNVARSVIECGSTGTCANTVAFDPRIIVGTRTLAAGTAVVASISPTFINAHCWTWDQTTLANPSSAALATSSSITITGTGTDVINYGCVLY